MTANSDTRVDSMHAKKMAALMQAEAKNGADGNRPILLRIDSAGGSLHRFVARREKACGRSDVDVRDEQPLF
ncbi:MAG TPA: hypothetical protein VES66_06180, partial [Terriglobales bacterium]|nr:hypothetical protein [Terriglobales bacterium]